MRQIENEVKAFKAQMERIKKNYWRIGPLSPHKNRHCLQDQYLEAMLQQLVDKDVHDL